VRPTVLLFDIDGTLINTGGAGRRAIDAAFEQVAGVREACASVPLAGMTDRAIVRAAFAAAGRAPSERDIDAVLDAYLVALAIEVAVSPGYRVLAGVMAALDAVGDVAGVAVGLGTGNVRRGAILKLARGGLDGRFAFGGFGCDHEARSEILRVAAGRGAERLGAPIAACRVVVIGDTPRDVAAAQAIGAECIAVATGRYGAAELARSGPTRVLADLADDDAVPALLGLG
jgi:phosphoglycolate phosphatase-like HAD superfamily hydrolase